jgi:glycosyltransferase involved in cell wall biosynthesis
MSGGESIAVFLPSFDGRRGGAEQVMLTLARSFADRGFPTDFVVAEAAEAQLADLRPKVRIVDLKSRRKGFLCTPAVIAYLRRERPAVLLTTLPRNNLVAIWSKLLARVATRVVVREAITISIQLRHDRSLRDRLLPPLMRWFYPRADAFVAVSRGAAQDLARTLGLPSERIRVIYNPAVTPAVFEKSAAPVAVPWFLEETPVILGVGRLTVQKNFRSLLQAFALVRRRRPARLVIFGEGDERRALEREARQLRVEQDVSLPGYIDNPYPCMARAAVLVLSSLWEGLPNVLIEALALGTPVVSSNCQSGPHEILDGGKYGSLVPVGDVEALASAILGSLDASPDRQRLQERAQLFSLERAVNAYLEVFGL